MRLDVCSVAAYTHPRGEVYISTLGGSVSAILTPYSSPHCSFLPSEQGVAG
jgi:hypothetical protein